MGGDDFEPWDDPRVPPGIDTRLRSTNTQWQSADRAGTGAASAAESQPARWRSPSSFLLLSHSTTSGKPSSVSVSEHDRRSGDTRRAESRTVDHR